MNWTSLADAGITYGDTFALHGDSKAKFQPVGRQVRVAELEGSKGYCLVDAETSEPIPGAQSTSFKRAKWWIA